MKRFIGLFLGMLSMISLADTHTGEGEVTEVWSGYQNGMTLFKLDIPHQNPKPCLANSFYVVDATKANSSNFLSLLLMAKANKSKVVVVLSDTECLSSYPVALRMGLK